MNRSASLPRLFSTFRVLASESSVTVNSAAPIINVNRSTLRHLSVFRFRGSCLVESRTCARTRDGTSLDWRNRQTQRLCEASSAASKGGGELRSGGDSGQSRSEVLQKHS